MGVLLITSINQVLLFAWKLKVLVPFLKVKSDWRATSPPPSRKIPPVNTISKKYTPPLYFRQLMPLFAYEFQCRKYVQLGLMLYCYLY